MKKMKKFSIAIVAVILMLTNVTFATSTYTFKFKEEINILKGEKLQLIVSPSITEISGDPISWTSGNTDIIKVSQSGLAEGMSVGKTDLYFLLEDGTEEYVTIVVIESAITTCKSHTMSDWVKTENPTTEIRTCIYCSYFEERTVSPTNSSGSWSNASDWAVPELKKAESKKIIPNVLIGQDMTTPITRTEFAAISVKLYEKLSGKTATVGEKNPFTDTYDLDVRKAYNLGITSGTSATTFSPNSLITREQMAAMLTRAISISLPNVSTSVKDANIKKFADDADISSYARGDVYFMYEQGLISGVGNNKFAPRNVTKEQVTSRYANATREQALAIAVRTVTKFEN